jgi:hypothetical protein
MLAGGGIDRHAANGIQHFGGGVVVVMSMIMTVVSVIMMGVMIMIATAARFGSVSRIGVAFRILVVVAHREHHPL